MRKALCLSVIVLFAAAMVSDAAIPRKVDYQGRLLDKNTKPVDGLKTMMFSLYDAAAGGHLLYSETQSVTVTKGIFNVTIGSVTPIPDIGVDDVWLQVTVEGEILSPRKQLVTVPFAFAAEHADQAGTAEYATNAGAAQNAVNADEADHAANADYATNAGQAANATNAVNANHAATADSATNSTSVGGLNLTGLDGRFVNVSGDTMTGALTVNNTLTSSNAMINWDATINRMLLVCPGGTGAIKVGSVEQFVGNSDIAAANHLRADGCLYLGSSKFHGNIYLRDKSLATTIEISGQTGAIYMDGEMNCGAVSADGAVTCDSLEASGIACATLNATGSVNVLTGLIGSFKCGDVSATGIYNSDMCAGNHLRVDKNVYIGSSDQHGNLYVRDNTETTRFSVYGQTGNIDTDGSLTCGTSITCGTTLEAGNFDGTLSTGDVAAGYRLRAMGGLYLGSASYDGDISARAVGGMTTFTVDGGTGTIETVGDLRLKANASTTTFFVDSATGTTDVGGDINLGAGYGIDFDTNSGSIWQMYGSSASGSNKLYISGPSNGEIQIDASYALITLGSSSSDVLKIPATIEDGIVVTDNIGGGATSCAVLAQNTHAGGIAMTGNVTSTDSCAVLINKGTGNIIKGFSGATGGALVFEVRNNGRVVCTELQITGGADLAEPFKAAAAEPGMVMSIDPARPGELRVSAKPYDRTVAGIVSGANGIKPGMTMSQADSPADGNLPVALSGRVYCWCDASIGAIQPGDLLTTSGTPGHAMKVSDHARATGATIGKAMTALESGRGLVLVLVNLQ